MEIVRIAANQAAGRLLVIGQSNHTSSRVALSTARRNVAAGANLISVAILRLFALSDDDLFRYLVPILNAVDVPVVVQDFNPGGPTISSGFVVRLLAQCPNIRYLKLEEPLSAMKVIAIREATQERVEILARGMGRPLHDGTHPVGHLWRDAGPWDGRSFSATSSAFGKRASQREHSAYSARYCLISCSHCRILNCISTQRSAFCGREECCGTRIAEEQATLPTCPPISM